MRFHAKNALLFVLLFLAVVPIALAQESQHKTTAPRPLSRHEGLSIVHSALHSRHHAGSVSDCSHLVHALYERAGFPYDVRPLFRPLCRDRRIPPSSKSPTRRLGRLARTCRDRSQSRSAFLFQPAEFRPRSRFLGFALLETVGTTPFLSLPQAACKGRPIHLDPQPATLKP